MKPDLTALRAKVREIEDRKPLSRKEAVHLAVIQRGLCGCGCGEPIDVFGEGFIDEHVIPLQLTGSNNLENRALFRVPCAAEKTKDDVGRIAKAKRLAGETCTGPRRTIPNRGFQTSHTRGFDGVVRPKKAKRT